MLYMIVGIAVVLAVLIFYRRTASGKDTIAPSSSAIPENSAAAGKSDSTLESSATEAIPEFSEDFRKSASMADESSTAESMEPNIKKRSMNEAAKLRRRGDFSGAYKASKFLPPIQKGYQIFLQNMGVTGLGYRRADAVAFIDDHNQSLRLEREPDNSVDRNAIKVIGIGESGEYFIGYLPKDAAAQITETNSFDSVYGRLVRAYRGSDDYLEIQLQIVGLKEKKEAFDAYAKNLPANESQKEYLTYWNLPFESELTTGLAQNLINEHMLTNRNNAAGLQEFRKYQEIIEEFQDEDQLEYHELKEVPRQVLIHTLTSLKEEVGSYEEIYDDLEMLADRIREAHPELALN